MSGTIEAVRAEALFVSPVQASEAPGADRVRDAVTLTLHRVGELGCAVRVAGEFGEHPETAAARMGWAITAVRTAFGRDAVRPPEVIDPAQIPRVGT